MIQEAEETPATLSLLENLSQAVLSPTTTPTRPNRPRRAAAKMTPRPERGGGVWDRTRAQRIARVAGWLVLGHSFATVSALRCFSCIDCSVGGALSATIQQCEPSENFCATVFRPRARAIGLHGSSVDRGCASSINVECLSDGTADSNHIVYPEEARKGSERGNKRKHDDEPTAKTSSPVPSSSSALGAGSRHCCSTDLCNRSSEGTQRTEGYRRSEEHRRHLMEGTRSSKVSRAEVVADTEGVRGSEGEGEEGIGNNSAYSARVGGGSRLATVLVIVGTFAQALWLAGSLLQ